MEKFFLNNETGKIAFVEKITSNVTHEINNILSIINEYTGIIDDKIYSYEHTGNLDIEKIKLYKEKIYTQISRGKKINKLLNQFSHSIDEEFRYIEINEEIEKFIELTERIAKSNETQLKFEKNDELTVRINLFEFLRIFFQFLYLLAINSQPKTEIEIFIKNNYINLISYYSDIEKLNNTLTAMQQSYPKLFEKIIVENDNNQIKVKINLEAFQ